MLSIGHKTAVDMLRTACCAGSLIVDAGAFPGGLTRVLANHWKVIALDKNPDRGLTLQHRFKIGETNETQSEEITFKQAMADVGVEARTVDLECGAWPIESVSIDAVVMTEVIEHLWVNPLLALTEANRILKPGGILLISTPNFSSLRNRVNFLRGRMERVIEHPLIAFVKKIRLGHAGHVRLYTPEELEMILKTLGFKSTFHFRSFQFWDPAVGQSRNASETPVVVRKRSVLRKIFKSPANYVNAVVATATQCLERIHPAYRTHMYVIARKVREVSYADLSGPDIIPLLEEEGT